MNKEEPINITHLGWRNFILGNKGRVVAYMEYFPKFLNGLKVQSRLPLYISYVDIPDALEDRDKIRKTINFWSIAFYHHHPFVTQYHINSIRVSKETFISTLAEDYPTHLEWFLFHPEWLTQPCQKE